MVPVSARVAFANFVKRGRMSVVTNVRLLALLVTIALSAALPALASANHARSATRAATSAITYAEYSGTTTLPTDTIKSSGGDGYDVFFDDADHVFNIYHHDTPASVDCHMLNGTSCGPGWPFSVSPYHTSLWVSGYVDSKNDKLWFPTNDAGHSGFGCLEIGRAHV